MYGLIDSRSKQIFYIGKSNKNIVFEHEKENLGSPDSDKLKLKTIAEIKNAGLEVEKIIINLNLTEEEVFAAEESLINAFNYVSDAKLTNIAAGHHSAEALSVDIFEKWFDCNDLKNHVFIIENHKYNQKMGDCIINNTAIIKEINNFMSDMGVIISGE